MAGRLNLLTKRRGAACCIALMAGLATGAFAQDHREFDGPWQQTETHTALVPADGSAIPFTEEGRAAYEANRAAANSGDFSFDLTMTSCASPGQPRLMLTNRPFAIFVRPKTVTVIYEWNRLFRQISMGKPLVNPALGDGWWEYGSAQGHARAHWEGDELVIDTRYFYGGRLLDAFLPASDQLVLTERWRLVGEDRLENSLTINDPVNYTRPWEAKIIYERLPADSYPFREDVCFDRLRAGEPAIER